MSYIQKDTLLNHPSIHPFILLPSSSHTNIHTHNHHSNAMIHACIMYISSRKCKAKQSKATYATQCNTTYATQHNAVVSIKETEWKRKEKERKIKQKGYIYQRAPTLSPTLTTLSLLHPTYHPLMAINISTNPKPAHHIHTHHSTLHYITSTKRSPPIHPPIQIPLPSTPWPGSQALHPQSA